MFKLVLVYAFLLSACGDGTNETGSQSESCETEPEQEALVDFLNDRAARPFDGADPDGDDALIDPLVAYLGEAHLVGLGEATHGTSEFYSMKDKIFRKLVRDKGFKAVVFEIPWGNAMIVNDYVVNGIGNAEAAVNQTYYWVYDTQEVRDLVEWMRDYNRDLPEADRIWFVGCDPQGGDFVAERTRIGSFLHRAAPDSAASLLEYYSGLPAELSDYASSGHEVLKNNRHNTKVVVDHLIRHKDDYIARSSRLDYELALMAAHVIQGREYIYRVGNSGVPRDSLMAIYSEWWQEILGDDARVAIWAHNAHVMDAADLGAFWMGTYLRQRHHGDYRNVAFSFGTGAFNAFLSGPRGEFQGGVREQFIPEWECGSVNHLLSLVDGEQHYILMDSLEGIARSYFNTPQSFVQLGAGFNYQYIHNYSRQWRMAAMFDVLIHFDETSASILK